MIVKVKKEVLLDSLQITNNVITEKTLNEILKNVLFDARNNVLKIKATDLEIYISSIVENALIESEGRITIPGRALLELVRELSVEEDITLTTTEINEIKINIPELHIDATLKGESADKYPKSIDLSENNFVEMPLDKLKELVKKCYFAAGIDPSRKFMEGILIEFFGQEIRLVTTDSERLVLIKDNMENKNIENKISLLFPKRISNEILKYTPKQENMIVKIFYAENDRKALLKFGDETEIFTRLIDAKFPDYMRVIPEEYNFLIKINKEKLINTISIVSIFSDNLKSPQIYLTLRENKAIFESHSENLGRIVKEIDIDYNEAEFKTSFNGRHFKECIKEINSDEISIAFIEKDKPMKIKPIDNDNHIIVIMPMII